MKFPLRFYITHYHEHVNEPCNKTPATLHKLDTLIKQGAHMATDLDRLKVGVDQLKVDAQENKAAAEQAVRDLEDLSGKVGDIKQQLADLIAAGGAEPGALAALAASVEGVSAGLDATTAKLSDASQRNDPPAGTAILPAGTVGQSYSAPLGLPGVVDVLVSGDLPSGLHIGTREVIGVPDTAGTFSFVAQGQAAPAPTRDADNKPIKDADGNPVLGEPANLGDPQAFSITIG